MYITGKQWWITRRERFFYFIVATAEWNRENRFVRTRRIFWIKYFLQGIRNIRNSWTATSKVCSFLHPYLIRNYKWYHCCVQTLVLTKEINNYILLWVSMSVNRLLRSGCTSRLWCFEEVYTRFKGSDRYLLSVSHKPLEHKLGVNRTPQWK